MGSFGSFNLASKFGIILGSLMLFTCTAGMVKLWLTKRRLKKHIKLDAEAAAKPRQEKNLAGRENDPRYLFGVRALEKGFYGGVAQTSRQTSASPSTSGGSISSASTKSVANSTTTNHSNASFPIQQNRAKRKPSPLRLSPSISPKAYSPTSPRSGHAGSPTAPSDSISVQDFQELNNDPVKLAIPKATANPARPKSYLPRLQFLPDMIDPETSFFISTPAASVRSRKSRTESAYTSEGASQPDSSTYDELPSTLPPILTVRPRGFSSQKPEKEILTRRATVSNDIPVPPIPETYSAPNRRESGAGRSSDRDLYHDYTIRRAYTERKSSNAMSLAALTGDTIVSSVPNFEGRSTRAAPIQAEDAPMRGRNPNPSLSHKPRSSSGSQSLSRTHDSLRRSSRKMSRERSASNRRSKQRDQMHYDPTPQHRNRSGSIQGRAVDFSKPRESPFTDLAAISTYKHSPSSSSSSNNSISTHDTTAKAQATEKLIWKP